MLQYMIQQQEQAYLFRKDCAGNTVIVLFLMKQILNAGVIKDGPVIIVTQVFIVMFIFIFEIQKKLLHIV